MSTSHDILDATCFVTLMTRDMITGPGRLPRVMAARRLFIAVATLEGKKLSIIARALKRDRTTVFYHQRVISGLDGEAKANLMRDVERVRAELRRRTQSVCLQSTSQKGDAT